MKYLKLLLLICVLNLSAQSQQLPISWTQNIGDTPLIKLKKPNLATLKAEDAVNDLDKSIPWRFGYDHYVDYGLGNSGTWHELPNGDRVWRINIISPKALSMNVIFDRFKIPLGGKVYIYNDDHSEILNPYTHEHNSPEEILGTWMVKGDNLWIEYFEPKKVRGQGYLNIGNIIHGYRTLESLNGPEKALNDSGDCNVDVNCDISAFNTTAHDIKENVKNSVAMVVVGGGTGICSGALVNNTSNDGTPYFLTANHCLGGSIAGWAYRFNWASDASVADCATTAPSVNNTFIQTASGGILRAANSESDMALVEISDTAFFTTNAANLVWAGWNRSTTDVPTLTVGIHHPSGDIQKVCVDVNVPTRQAINFNGNPSTEIWRVADWDLGVTEPGSSGSPLFDQNGLIIGKLSGGFAACSGTVDNNTEDWYGRFGVSWDFSPNSSQQLKFWLDPAGTNPTTIDQFPPLQVFDLDASISVSGIDDFVCESTISPTIRITNRGNFQLTSATIMYQVNSDPSSTINWTGSLANGEFEDIPVGAVAVSGSGAQTFTATVSNPNGGTDEDPSDNQSTTAFTVPVTYVTNSISVIITPDRYGAETTWQVESSDGTIIATGGPYTTVGTNGTQPDEIASVTIPSLSDCYTFTLFDSFGDGICCLYGAGTYRIEDSSNNVIVNGNGVFDFETSDTFKVNQVLSINDDQLANTVSIYPNPSQSNFNIDYNGSSNLQYEIYTLTGQKLNSGNISNGINTILMQEEASGVYFLNVIDTVSGERFTEKLIKN